MSHDDKEFIIHLILFWVMILIMVINEFFDFITDSQFAYISIVWIIAVCATSLYRWHLETND
jgi:hypothetical protein